MATSALAYTTVTETDPATRPRPRPAAPKRARPTTRPAAADVAQIFGSAELQDLRRMAVRLAGASIDPDDLLHDTLERALASLDRFVVGSNLHAWLRTIMFRLVVDQTRSRRRRKARTEIERWALPTATPAVDELDEPAAWAALDLDDVRHATAQLSEPLKDTFMLFALEGLSYDQVAQRLGILPQTVGTRVLRAKLKLRTVLAERAHGADVRPVLAAAPASGSAAPPASVVSARVPPCRLTAQLAA